MDPWVWLTAYLVSFAALQLFLYHYFNHRDSTPDTGFRGGKRAAPRGDLSKSVEGDEIRCGHCGSLNEAEPMYTYCQTCTRRLE